MTPRSWPLVGSEAIAEGLVRKHELRSSYQVVYPDVYAPAGVSLTVEHRAKAAWLWSHRQGVIAGLTASALHGARWVDPTLPIELVWSNARQPSGLITSDARLRPDEYTSRNGLRLTTVTRTAYDLARRGRLDERSRDSTPWAMPRDFVPTTSWPAHGGTAALVA